MLIPIVIVFLQLHMETYSYFFSKFNRAKIIIYIIIFEKYWSVLKLIISRTEADDV